MQKRNSLLCIDTILSLWTDQPGKYAAVSTARRNNGDAKSWNDEFFRRSQLDQIVSYVRERVDTHEVYVAPRLFNKTERKGEYAAGTTLAYADLDARNPSALAPAWRPHVAFETSPGRYQAIWVCDDDVPEELNQRLTYHVGADKGGWGTSKVLRLIAGTINHKYPAKPRVRLLWDERSSRPPLAVSELRKLAGPSAPRPTPLIRLSKTGSFDRDDLMHRYARRRDVLRKQLEDASQVFDGKRSAIMYRHARTLMERGASNEEIFVLFEPAGFNKWAGDPDALRDDIERIRARGGRP